MISAATFIALCVALPPLLALAIYSVEVLTGIRPLATRQGNSTRPRIAVLIPAHDEAAGVGNTVARLRSELGDGGRILVVADNCKDATAHVAAEAGADVIKRCDPVRRGKGFALSFGREHLALDPPEVVVVLDADSAFIPGSLGALASAAADGAPAQAVNLLYPDRGAPPLIQISSFALLVKNLIRARATTRLGGAALLTGTGMAFDWKTFAKAPLATGDIVEDLGLGLSFLRVGIRPRLVEQAQVRSAPAGLSDAQGQRRRWEHGFLATALRQSPRLLLRGLTTGSRPLLVFGAHLLVPPLALLFLLSGLALLITSALAFAGASSVPAFGLIAGLGVASCVTVLAWVLVGRAWLAPGALLRAPLYVLWKVPLYARFIFARETHWVRTRREED
jgi:cellulose synthase/poly-beta-1,6-N-acetylglucosamine synthase-like glycosyltransferase